MTKSNTRVLIFFVTKVYDHSKTTKKSYLQIVRIFKGHKKTDFANCLQIPCNQLWIKTKVRKCGIELMIHANKLSSNTVCV